MESSARAGPFPRVCMGEQPVPKIGPEIFRNCLRRMRRSGLVYLATADPIPEWVFTAKSDELAGTLRLLGQDIGFRFRRTATLPPSFELEVADWPDQVEAVCIVLGQFAFPRLETEQAAVRTTYRTPRLPAPDTSDFVGSDVGAYSLAADAPPEPEPVAQQSIRAQFDRDRNTLTAAADYEGVEEGELLVVELEGTDHERNHRKLRRLIYLSEQLPVGGWRGSRDLASEMQEFKAGTDVSIAVRAPTSEDMDLVDQLEPDQALTFLARQEYLTMPITKTEEGQLVIRARWEDQQAVAVNPETVWLLQVALPEEEEVV